MINNSVMKCCICNNEKYGEFITINDNKYHLCCIEQLQQENNQLKEQLEKKYEKVGTLTTEILYEENSKLQSVLKELRRWLEEKLASDYYSDGMYYGFKSCLSKLNELEGKNE